MQNKNTNVNTFYSLGVSVLQRSMQGHVLESSEKMETTLDDSWDWCPTEDLPVTRYLQRCLRIRDHPSKNLQDLLSLDNSPIHQDPWKALQRELLTGGYRRQKQHAAVHLTTCRRPPRYSTTPLQRSCANGEDKSWASWWKVHAVMFREKPHIPQSSTAECQAGKKLNHHQ